MTSHPMFMIRRGRHKYIHCDTDPPLLFDLVTDPDERSNLAGEAQTADLAAEFAIEVHDRWNSNAIRGDVLASQRHRRTIHDSMTIGRLTSWDYSPTRDVANEYVRNHMNWSEVGSRTRYPPFES